MPRPFAYNPGSSISGTDKFGNLSVGTSTQNYNGNYGGVRWWNGPEETSGYIIAYARESSQTPGFRRSSSLTDQSFLNLVNSLPARSGQSPFVDGTSAKTWLNANGYWTSWVSSTPPGPVALAYLDASDVSSYPGTGSTWYDTTVNNNDGTLSAGSGTLTFSSSFGGEFDLSGGSGTRISFVDNTDTRLSTTSSKAYSIWFKADAVGFVNFSKTLICKQIGTGGSTNSDGLWMGINSTNQLVARVTSDNGLTSKSIAGIGATVSIGTWYMATLVVKVSPDPDTFKLYLNTTEVGSTNGGGTSLTSDNRSLLLGNYDAGVQNAQAFDGMIGDFYVHEDSVEFDAVEVQTLFDATKTRFGY